MILSPLNSTNPSLWGSEIKFGQIKLKPTVPDEFDFFNYWFGINPAAKTYYQSYLNESI